MSFTNPLWRHASFLIDPYHLLQVMSFDTFATLQLTLPPLSITNRSTWSICRITVIEWEDQYAIRDPIVVANVSEV